MSKNLYIGVNGTSRKITDIYIGINGIARKVIKGYIGINGIAHQFFGTGIKYKYYWDPLNECDEYTINETYCGIDGDEFKFLVDIYGNSYIQDVCRLYIYCDDLSGKSISFDYKSSFYSASYCTTEYKEVGEEDVVNYTKALNTSSWTSFSKTISSNTRNLVFGIWILSSKYHHISSECLIRNLYIDGEKII